jgi:hypothetical protein
LTDLEVYLILRFGIDLVSDILASVFSKLMMILADRSFTKGRRLEMAVRFVVRCIVIAALLLSAQVASAQQAPQTPAQVLSQSPNGGPAMVTQVQNLLNADKANLAAIIAFAKTATEDQRKAIAQGLAQVAKSYAASDPAFATQIQQQVAASGLPEFAKAYAEAAGDTGTASAGGGGGGGGGGPTAVGPPTGGSNNGANVTGSTFAANQTGLTTGGSLGGGGFSQISPF